MRMWKACRVVQSLFSFSPLFFPFFFSILSLVSRQCGWGWTFNVWNSSFRSENGELGLSAGSGISYQRRGLEYFDIPRWLTVQINANRGFCFRSRMTDIRLQRCRLCSSSVRAQRPVGVFRRSCLRRRCLLTPARDRSLLEKAAAAAWAC